MTDPAHASSLTQPRPFDYQRHSSNATRWASWVRNFNIFLKAAGVEGDEPQLNTFLYVVGEDVAEIYDSLNPRKTKDEEAIKVITDHFTPIEHKDSAILRFRKMKQNQGESIDSFVDRLRIEAKNNNFTNPEDDIRLQVIQGAFSNKIRQKGETEVCSLKDLISLARNLENQREQHVQQTIKHEYKQEHVNQVFKRNTFHNINNNSKNGTNNNYTQIKSKPSTCGMCGFDYPHKNNCPALGKKCNNCGRFNHFTKCCRSKPTNQNHQQKNYQHKRNSFHKTHHLSTENNNTSTNREPSQAEKTTDSSDIEKSFAIGLNTDVYNVYSTQRRNHVKCPRVEVLIGDQKINMGPDTQSSINAISVETYNQLQPRPKLQPNHSLVYAYDSKKPMKSIGQFETKITANHRSIVTKIMVFENVRDNLLSFKSCIDLQILNRFIDKTNSITTEDEYQILISKYLTVFTNKIGKLKNFKLKFHINNNIKPFIEKPRRHPIHLKDKIEDKLRKMEEDGIIEDATGPTPWVSEILAIPKPNQPDKLRIVMDARAVNCAIERERHNTPTLDELVVDLNGAQYFSKIDLIEAYHQIEIDESSRYVTVFRTPLGLKQYKRLTQGIKSAQEQFHHTLEVKLEGLKGVKNLIDDIYVHGKTKKEHDQRLIALLDRLKSLGLTINKEKCEFGKTSLDFYGLNFSQNGISITEQKIKALKEALPPKTASELRSFLGLASWCSRSIENFATLSESLWKLTRNKVKWIWTADHEKVFNIVKTSVCEKALGYFDKSWLTCLEVDASPVGAAAILYQEDPKNREDKKVIIFWSQLFSDIECRYSQTEKEALAIVLACEKFEIYLIGKPFTLITDNKAVELIFRNPRSKPPARILRWNLRLMEFHFNIIHKPGCQNVADYLSRNPINNNSFENNITKSAEEFVNSIEYYTKPSAFKLEEIIQATKIDKTIQKVIKSIQDNEFSNDSDIVPFKNIRNDLSVSKQGILLRDTRMVIPESLQYRAIQIAHEGHQGISKTKRLLRERIWFPHIDKMTENLLSECTACQLNNRGNKREELKMTEFPKYPWQEISLDFFGPLPNNNELLVVTDQHSRFPYVVEVKTTSSIYVLPVLDNLFSLMGIPETILTDNGPPFMSYEFNQFCGFFGIKHRKATPLWPESNGQVENFNKNIKKIIKTAFIEHTDWKTELNAFLRSYRSTPHSSTNKSPASLLFINSNTSRLPAKIPNVSSEQQNQILLAELNDKFAKYKMKIYADKRRKTTKCNFRIGDRVLYHQLNNKINNKYTNQFSSVPYTIKNIKGSMITVVNSNNKELTRNSSFFKQISPNLVLVKDDIDEYEPTLTHTNTTTIATTSNNTNNSNNISQQRTSNLITTQNNSRPLRENRNKLPLRFKDYVM